MLCESSLGIVSSASDVSTRHATPNDSRPESGETSCLMMRHRTGVRLNADADEGGGGGGGGGVGVEFVVVSPPPSSL